MTLGVKWAIFIIMELEYHKTKPKPPSIIKELSIMMKIYTNNKKCWVFVTNMGVASKETLPKL